LAGLKQPARRKPLCNLRALIRRGGEKMRIQMRFRTSVVAADRRELGIGGDRGYHAELVARAAPANRRAVVQKRLLGRVRGEEIVIEARVVIDDRGAACDVRPVSAALKEL